jgi:hypothetical protein
MGGRSLRCCLILWACSATSLVLDPLIAAETPVAPLEAQPVKKKKKKKPIEADNGTKRAISRSG